jgi:hypothetical protein
LERVISRTALRARVVVRLGPLAKRPFDGLPERVDTALCEEDERENHGLPFRRKMKP